MNLERQPEATEVGAGPATSSAEQSAKRFAEAFVLAGGRSSRMGRDKAFLRIAGRTLVELALEKLRSLPLAVPPRIAGSRPDLAAYAPVIEDLRPGCGPLGGMEAALTATTAQFNVFVAVDLPLLPGRLLAWMLERAALTGALATFPRANGRPQPLCGVYHRDALQRVSRALAASEYSVIGTFASARAVTAENGVKLIDSFDVEMLASIRAEIRDFSPLPIAYWFRNCNSPEDLAALDPLVASIR